MSLIAGIHKNNELALSVSDQLRAIAPFLQGSASTWHGPGIALLQGSFLESRENTLTQVDDYVLAADARLDNRSEIAALLGIPACSTDELTLLSAWRRWGPLEACRKCRGDFAVAVWDGRALTLARSPLGTRPLFYAASRDWLVFGSTLPLVLALPDVPRRLRGDYFSSTDPLSTIFAGVRQVGAGRLLTFAEGAICETRFWQLDLHARRSYASDRDCEEEFLELLRQAVATRAMCPVGLSLSGGLDSAAIAATLCRDSPQPVLSFTQVPKAGAQFSVGKSRYTDERPLVEEIVRMHPSLRPAFIHSGGRRFFQGLDEYYRLTYLNDLRNEANRLWVEAIYAAARDSGCRVLLVGDRGNTTATWSGIDLVSAHLARRQWARAWQATAHYCWTPAFGARVKMLIKFGAFPLLPRWLRRALSGRPQDDAMGMHFPPFIRQRRGRRGLPLVVWRDGAEISRREDRATLTGLEGEFPTTVAAEGRFGLSVLDPFTDQRLVEFCFALPDEQFLRGGRARSLVRRAFQGRLPAAVLANSRRGLQAPEMAQDVQAQLPDLVRLVEEHARSPLVREFVDTATLSGWLSEMERSLDPVCAWRLLHGASWVRYLAWLEREVGIQDVV